MFESTTMIGLVVILVVVIAALAGIRFKYNNNVYGAEANAHAATYRVLQEQIENLSKQLIHNNDKVREVQMLFEEANKYVQELRRENEKLQARISRLRRQLRDLGKEPVE